MYDIRDLKIGDIMVYGFRPNRQLFYIHNIDLDRELIESSGVKEEYADYFFDKCYMWDFDRLATLREVALFYELIDRHGLKFNINTGVSRC